MLINSVHLRNQCSYLQSSIAKLICFLKHWLKSMAFSPPINSSPFPSTCWDLQLVYPVAFLTYYDKWSFICPLKKNKQNKKQNCGFVFQRDGTNAWQHRIDFNVHCQETYSINTWPFLVNIQNKFCFPFPFFPKWPKRKKMSPDIFMVSHFWYYN